MKRKFFNLIDDFLQGIKLSHGKDNWRKYKTVPFILIITLSKNQNLSLLVNFSGNNYAGSNLKSTHVPFISLQLLLGMIESFVLCIALVQYVLFHETVIL